MKNKYFWVGLLFVFNMSMNAQYGVLDHTLDPGVGADDVIQAMAVQPDHKIIIGGDFLNYGGLSKKRLTRLNGDGTLDTSFNVGSGANKLITSVTLQPDGKIIVTGEFTIFNNTSKKRIVRLNADGSIDQTFNPGLGANETVETCLLQPDGKIVISGSFTAYNWAPRNGIARLNSNGSLDTTFSAGDEPLVAADIKLLPNGNYLVNGVDRIVRLLPDGNIDMLFHSSVTDYPIQATCVQADGKIIVGGYFTMYGNTPVQRFIRLEENGVIDETFNNGVGVDYGVLTITEQPDQQILISGIFSKYNGVPIEKIARLHPDGTLDESFNPALGPNNIVLHHMMQPDGRILIAGDFTEYNGFERNKIARINAFSQLSVNHNTINTTISVYPNPADNQLSISFPENQTALSVKIFDLTGKVVTSVKDGMSTIDVSNLSKGVYMLSAVTETGTYNTRFVKQ